MTREEIKQLDYDSPYHFETDREEDWYKIGCIEGLDAADAEPDTTNIWHDASEEPENGELILVELVNTIPKNNEVRYFVEYVEKWVVGLMKTEGFQCRWAYISDLLPKGGEE